MNNGASTENCPDCDQVHHETSSKQLHSRSTYVHHIDMAHWGYHDIPEEGEYGPSSWAKNHEAAGGKRQSPIDIDTKATKPKTLPDLSIHYDPSRCNKIVNNGHTFTVHVEERNTSLAENNNAATIECESKSSTDLSGGPLEHKYQLAQFHCHWGSCDEQGAEHTIDGHRYAAELHLVHWNKDRFENIGEAISQDGGIAVLGVFLKAGKESAAWRQLTPHLKEVKYKGDSFRMKKGFDPITLLPENVKDYWTYAGSLTTPPCYESVQFILFREPFEVSSEQLEELRALSEHCKNDTPRGGCDGKMVDNFRPCMPLNGRVLHLVHWNTDRFENIGEAISQDGGIAVLGVFLKAGKESVAWRQLTPHLKEVKYKGDSFRMKKGFDPITLLPENVKDYWTYAGSLTTPPCYESVQFILFREPFEVSSEQLEELRALSEHCKNDTPRGGCDGKMVDNFRPCMPLNGRVVTASFSS